MEYHIIKKGINSVLADNLLFKLKLFLADLAFEYPFFTEWLEKVFKELTMTDSRLILLCCDNGIFDIKGVSYIQKIIKDANLERNGEKTCRLVDLRNESEHNLYSDDSYEFFDNNPTVNVFMDDIACRIVMKLAGIDITERN